MSTEGFSEESFSDEGISQEQAALNRKRKNAKKAKNQKRRSRKKLKKQLKKDNACFRCGREFCDCSQLHGRCGKNQFNLQEDVGATCTCQVCNFCFIRNFVGNATMELEVATGWDWHVVCPGGCGNKYLVPQDCVEWCAGSIGGLAEGFFQ